MSVSQKKSVFSDKESAIAFAKRLAKIHTWQSFFVCRSATEELWIVAESATEVFMCQGQIYVDE